MNVIFTCGGTAGHINPAIAVANIWKERYPDAKILFIGGKGGMEETLVPKAGFDLKVVDVDGAARGKSLRALVHNARVVLGLAGAILYCRKIIKEFGADVVVGTGGYCSFPALTAASLLKIPTCVHEANAMPGLTTRLVADRVDKVMVCFPESAKYYRHPEKVEVVGMPVRREFIYTKKEDARRELELDDRPVVMSAYGSLGAQAMNEMTGRLFRLEQDAGFPFQHIHAVGVYGWRWIHHYVRKQGVELFETPSIMASEYIYNMPTVMAAADIAISRAGASSCNEIAASGTPCILIPSPNVTDNHQEKNARAMVEQGAAVMILESECTEQRVMEEIMALLNDKERYESMRKALQAFVIPDSAERLCRVMEGLIKGKNKE